MDGKVISRKLCMDQFGAYISETLEDGTKRNISVKQRVMKSGRVITDEWVDDLGYTYAVGGETWQRRE